jgi:hypothetical protein
MTRRRSACYALMLLAATACARERDATDLLPPAGYQEPTPIRPIKGPRRAQRVRFAEGFYDLETAADGTSWRWMGETGRLIVPASTKRARLTLRVRVPERPRGAEPELTIESKGRALEARRLPAGRSVVDLGVDPSSPDAAPNPLILKVSHTVVAPPDQRRLGLAVESVEWSEAP